MTSIRTIDRDTAQGELLDVYRAMAARPVPPVYTPVHGGAPGIVRAHSMDPALMRVVFGATGTLHQPGGLGWADRELCAMVASRTNQCVY
jgi:hypothetical protein